MATLERGFERKLEDAILAEAEHELVGKRASLVYEFVELVHTLLRSYGQRHGYNVESTIDSLSQPEATRSGDRLIVRVGWESEQMDRWEFGTSDHTVDGDPILSFIWKDPPQWVREEFDQARGGGGRFESGWRVFLPETEPSGIPESRAIRDALNALRRVIE